VKVEGFEGCAESVAVQGDGLRLIVHPRLPDVGIRIIGTRCGTSAGKVVLWPTWPWNNADNLGAWWRAAS